MKGRAEILLFDRADSERFPGGDTVQMLATADFLRAHGHEVVISADAGHDLARYDLVLIFNLTRPYEAFLQAKAAQRAGKPYLLFPVYWNLDALEMAGGMRGKEWLKQLLSPGLKAIMRALRFRQHHRAAMQSLEVGWEEIEDGAAMIRDLLRKARFLCPNSQAEWAHLCGEFDVPELRDRVAVVHNGFHEERVRQAEAAALPVDLPERFICCAGGIGPRKNQLLLVQAANQARIPLVLVGRASAGCEGYAREVRSRAGDQVVFLDHLGQPEVFAVMKRSQGHIQPSYIETPGLVSLEAAALGCPIGVSDVPPVREYFGRHALYCNPHDVQSIATCLERLYHEPPDAQELRQHVERHYRWDIALGPLLPLVEEILDDHGRNLRS